MIKKKGNAAKLSVGFSPFTLSRMQMNILLSIGILLVGIFIAFVIANNATKATKINVVFDDPVVEIITTQKQNETIVIPSRGKVKAKKKLTLLSQVNGSVKYVNASLVDGGFVKKDELLLTIDDTLFSLELIKKRSAVESAKLFLEETKAKAKVARRSAKKNASPIALYRPQLSEAKAKLAAAEADLAVAKYQLEQTKISAPFDGRVIKTDVNEAQYLNAGQAVAEIYSLDKMAVRLPVSGDQLRMIGFNINHLDFDQLNKPKIELIANVNNKQFIWAGKIVRSEAVLDKNQLYYLVGEVEEPFIGDVNQPYRPPLEPGMFVNAKIYGIELNGIFVLPISAISDHNNVWVVSEENRLLRKKIDVYYQDADFAYVNAGLDAGTRVVVSSLAYALSGMKVNPKDQVSVADR